MDLLSAFSVNFVVLSLFPPHQQREKEMTDVSHKAHAVVVTNNIPVNKAFEQEFEDRFSKRVHLVDKAPGFIRNEVHRPKLLRFNHSTNKWEPDTEKQGYYQVSFIDPTNDKQC